MDFKEFIRAGRLRRRYVRASAHASLPEAFGFRQRLRRRSQRYRFLQISPLFSSQKIT